MKRRKNTNEIQVYPGPEFDVTTLNFFGMKSTDGGGRKPVNAPELSYREMNARGIYRYLADGQALMGWYCLCDENDMFWIYRIEHDMLYRYYYRVGRKPDLQLEKIWAFNRKYMRILWGEEFAAYPHIYVVDPSRIADLTMIAHTMTPEKAKTLLESQEVVLVDEQDYLTVDDV